MSKIVLQRKRVRLFNVGEIHLIGGLFLSLFDDPLNVVDEEMIHLVSSFIWNESRYRAHDSRKSNCTDNCK